MDENEALRQEETAAQTSRRRVGWLLVGLVAALLLLGVTAVVSFSQYLNQQLFLERQTHLLEITEKVSEIVDVTIDAAWGNAQLCEQLLRDRGGDARLETLPADLADMKRYFHREDAVILAFDDLASYYTSDGRTGHWSDPAIFLTTAPERQVLVSELPYLDANDVYMVFLQRMEQPLALVGTDRQIGYVAVALAVDSLKDSFAVPAFSNSCYTFIVNAEGRRIYKNAELQEFIDGYNLLTAMEGYEFINGGGIDDLRSALGNERQACLEFQYGDEPYYVGTAMIPSVAWEVMLFVPTSVLGANTNALIQQTSRYMLMIGAVILGMICIALLSLTSSYNDKRLMRQQQASNALLTKAAQAAEQANLAKSEFLSHMSHDIRTPINGIMGMTDIAEKHIDDQERTLDCLHKIDTASKHLLSLVNDVLDMSSIESGKTVLSHDPLDMSGVLGNCATIVSGQLIGRQVDFVTEFANFRHPTLFGDELRLRQIFINILGNAVKFTPDGGRIRFAADEIAAVDQRARFRFVIEDTGRGMSEAFLGRIFEPFSQEDGHDRSTYTGTGLGMAITKQFVDLMGGRIYVESQLGQGSKFTLELSFDIDREGLKALKARAAAPEIVDLTGMQVLLAEDNELNMEIATCMLAEDGIVVTPVQNGQEAVEAFQSSPPGRFDAILMDVMMPEMDGLEATRTIRALPRADAAAIPIIAMTANAYEEDRRQTQEAGMNEHLSKPINGKLLLETLASYYKGNSVQEETEKE